jgi:TfoX/Sxy family transcriptional regulator of competence genes
VAYDEQLAKRVRAALTGEAGLSERKMFGGLAFMLDGNMCCGVVSDRLMVRLGPELAQNALERPHVQPMDFTGRPMTGMVYVDPAGTRGTALGKWVEQAVRFTRSLPPKPPKNRSVRTDGLLDREAP